MCCANSWTPGEGVIDSSPMYGRSEYVIGKLAAGLSVTDKLWIATKVWTTGEKSGKTQIENSRDYF
jgi:diketogulonate reductase-like aldo/keto reductase